MISAVDPRIRLLAAVCMLVLDLSSSTIVFPGLLVGLCLPAAFFCGMNVRTISLRLLQPLLLIGMLLLLKALAGNGTPLFQLEIAGLSLAAYQEGLQEGLLIASRILGAVSVAVLMGQVMSFTEIMAALAWLRMPHGLIDISMFAWRALFMFYDDAVTVYTAQKNRLGYSGVKKGLGSFSALAGMLAIRAFDNSQTMTAAMAQRGYDGNLPLFRGSRPEALQLIGLLLFVIAATTVWAAQN